MKETRETHGTNKAQEPLNKRRRLVGDDGGLTTESSEGASLPTRAYLPSSQRSEESMPEVLARYRRWIKAGAWHDQNCFVCGKANNLEHCKTCPRSYHEACKPSEGAETHHEGVPAWYCDVCVGRGWHLSPPTLTPPTSPVPDLARLTAQMSDQTGRARQSGPARAKSARKSRYTTLPPDVDSALRILYGELETSAELRQRNDQLEAEVANLRRELDLQKQQTHLAQKGAEASRSSHAEITQLNEKISGMHIEISTLRDQKQELQTELQNSQEQLKKTAESLHNLKQTLTGLIKD